LEEPAPTVLQTELGEFAIAYEVNAYTRYPAMLDEIYSRLFEQIQDKCHEAGIELLAPHYSAIRDGNLTTIPDEHVPDNYTSPGFQVHPLGNLFQIDLNMGGTPSSHTTSSRSGNGRKTED
jgi:hypothetical protein